ncbi:hypothetical protein [Pedococcus sp. 5OH_020]|uniref:hypothetical protein n=1 Tax=Pedococcus sp. 5OH_020 TaxID=2989814 RepID=UPI0022E9A315|nr:hypothetical protein [Pedococcus sp. 5OH_020]
MPRANRRRRDDAPLNLDRTAGGLVTRQRYGAEEWFVRRVTGAGAGRDYLCPGCQQSIPPGMPHVVVWPAEGIGGIDDRRHWHTPCWDARERRHTTGAIR